MPFLVSVGFIIVLLLLLQLFFHFYDRDNAARLSLTVLQVEGGASKLSWGEKEWNDIQKGQTAEFGDELRTLDGRLFLSLKNIVFAGLDSQSSLVFENLPPFGDGAFSASFDLSRGTLYVSDSDMENKTAYSVESFLLVPEKQTEFIIQAVSDRYAFDVVQGNLAVQYFAGVNRVMNFILPAGAGATFTRQSLTDIILGQLHYEDFLRPNEFDQTIQEFISLNQNIHVSDVEVSFNSGTSLAVLFPQEGAVISESAVHIKGLAPAGTYRIGVLHLTSESNEVYFLRKFKSGDSQWFYSLSSEYGNFYHGENAYEILAFDKDGNEIARTKLSVVRE